MNIIKSNIYYIVCPLLLFGLAVVLILAGLGLGAGGLILLHGGRASLDLLSGPLLIASGVELFRGRKTALHIFILYFVLVWGAGLLEVGLDGWSLLPRVDMACLILPFFYLPMISNRLVSNHISHWWQGLPRFRRLIGPGFLSALALAVLITNSLPPKAAPVADRLPSANTGDWAAFGGTAAATKFSSLADINPGNARHLKRLWEYIEPAPEAGPQSPARKDEGTPLQVGDKIFICQPDNVVLALDAETGKRIWRYDPHTRADAIGAQICRGLAYFEDNHASSCPRRLLTGTIDARLIAIDADSGRPCQDFGANGQVDLKVGLGEVKQGYYYVTSPPTVANGVAVVGALVRDNESIGEPSGVIRAYDVHSGKLRWAWDMGRPTLPATPLKARETYTRGTPNAWTIFSADPVLGLVFIPMGNATPDFVAQHRNPNWERYASALVALDLATGQPRWTYQTVHHDLWDYDLSAQPVLADLPIGGKSVPAVIIATKRGDIFVLDRRDGHPLSPVEERSVPRTDVAGEWTSPTQPFPVSMPALGGPPLRDSDMWGITPFDRLWCRISFNRLRYEGAFTPPSVRGSIEYPGTAGGVDWGGISFDHGRHLLLVPTLNLAYRVRLFPRDKGGEQGSAPQSGTPYSAAIQPFMTRLGIPCQRPPYAKLTAVDMVTQRIVWTRPLGTAEAVGPLGIPSHLPFTLGAPPLVGGVITTAGDISFIGAVGDRRLRAIDTRTGRELWNTQLPEGNQATPITYRAPKSGRQIVLIVSGGSADLSKARRVATHVVAYAVD